MPNQSRADSPEKPTERWMVTGFNDATLSVRLSNFPVPT